jgi:hypothetical protein
MTFVHDQVPVLADPVVDHTLAAEALNERDVEQTVGSIAPSADLADAGRRQVQKRRQPLHPLIEQLPPVDEHQRVDAPLCDEPCGDDSFSEGGGRGQHARLVREHRLRRDPLFRPELPSERRAQRHALKTLIPDDRRDLQVRQQFQQVVKASAR